MGSIINYLKEIQFLIILAKNQLTGSAAVMGNEIYYMNQLNILGGIELANYTYDNAFFKVRYIYYYYYYNEKCVT